MPSRPKAPCPVAGTRSGIDGNHVIDGVDHAYSRRPGFATRLTPAYPARENAKKDETPEGPKPSPARMQSGSSNSNPRCKPSGGQGGSGASTDAGSGGSRGGATAGVPGGLAALRGRGRR